MPVGDTPEKQNRKRVFAPYAPKNAKSTRTAPCATKAAYEDGTDA